MYVCSSLKRVADDLVCFYFVLSGFTISWGYMTRDFDLDAVKRRYWIGRLQRFYPDFFIATAFCILIKRKQFFGCHDLNRLDWVFNIAQLLLIGGWLEWVPFVHLRNLNGPSWFLITLVWLWFLYPWLIRPVKDSFAGNTTPVFVCKIIVLWVISLLPWIFILGFQSSYESIGYHSLSRLAWAMKPFPLFRIPEFLIGMALAVRLSQDSEYTELRDPDSGWRRSGSILLWGSALGVAGVAVFAAVGSANWDTACECLSLGCYGWLQLVDTRFALLAALVIYAAAGLDAAAAAAADPKPEAQAAAVRNVAGPAAELVYLFLTWSPFQEVNKWGLQAFLYQIPVQVVFQALLVDIGFGLISRCEPQALNPVFAFFYVLSQVCLTYLVAWIFHDKGPIGRTIHSAAAKLAAMAISLLDGPPSPPGDSGTVTRAV